MTIRIQLIDRISLLGFSPRKSEMFPACLIRIGNSRISSHQNFPILDYKDQYKLIHEVTFDNVAPSEVYTASFGSTVAGLRPLSEEKAQSIANYIRFCLDNQGTMLSWLILSEYFGTARAGSLALSVAEYYGNKDLIYQYNMEPGFFVNGHVVSLMRKAFGTTQTNLDKMYATTFGNRLTPSLNGQVK